MWLTLEYDRVLQAQTISRLERVGIVIQGVDREEQLQAIEKSKLDLIIVGAGWQKPTIDSLRSQGMDCPMVLMVQNVGEESFIVARELGCVDAVPFNVPLEYLRHWARVSINDEVAATAELQQTTVMDDILASHQVFNRKRTYTGSINSQSDRAEDDTTNKTRGRVVTVHSARGGVGKTIVVSALARHMANRNFSVAVVDTDPKGNILSVHRGQAAVTTDEWSRLPAQMDERMVKQSLVNTQGFYILPSGKQRDGMDLPTLRRAIYHLSQYFDLVLVDTTPSSKATDVALELAHKVVFVISPEWVSAKRFIEEYQAIEHSKSVQNVTVVINRVVKRRAEHIRTMRLFDEAKINANIVTIPEDATLYKELVNAEPLVGGREVRDGIEHLASSLRFDPMVEQVRSENKKKWGWKK